MHAFISSCFFMILFNRVEPGEEYKFTGLGIHNMLFMFVKHLRFALN